MNRPRLIFVISALAPILCSMITSAFGQDLMVEPKRIVLTDRDRAGIATLYNNSDDTVSYSIGWQHLRMLEDGSYQTMDSVSPGDLLADDLVRFFPPEVTLPPHSAQTVRLRFLKPQTLPPLEYRSHLTFVGIDKSAPVEWTVHDTLTERLHVMMKPVWGISIPIIVRADTTPPTLTLDSLSISPQDSARRLKVSVNINRSGVESGYGTLIFGHRDSTGESTQFGVLRNVAIYPPLRTRRVVLSFKIPPSINLNSGTIYVQYKTASGGPLDRIQTSTQLALGQ